MRKIMVGTILAMALLCAVFATASARYVTVSYSGQAVWYSPGIACVGNNGTCYTTVVWVDDAVWTCNCTVQPREFTNAGFYSPTLGIGYAYATISLFEPSGSGTFLGYTLQTQSVPVTSVSDLLSKYPGVGQ